MWTVRCQNTEEEPRTSDGEGLDGTDELTVNTNVQIMGRPHRRPSPGFDESPTLIKPIPRGSSFFIFSHTNRLALSANGQTNPFFFFSFFFFLSVCVCVCIVRQNPFRQFFYYYCYYSGRPPFCTYFSFTHNHLCSLFLSLCPSLPNCCKLALSRRGLG